MKRVQVPKTFRITFEGTKHDGTVRHFATESYGDDLGAALDEDITGQEIEPASEFRRVTITVEEITA